MVRSLLEYGFAKRRWNLMQLVFAVIFVDDASSSALRVFHVLVPNHLRAFARARASRQNERIVACQTCMFPIREVVEATVRCNHALFQEPVSHVSLPDAGEGRILYTPFSFVKVGDDWSRLGEERIRCLHGFFVGNLGFGSCRRISTTVWTRPDKVEVVFGYFVSSKRTISIHRSGPSVGSMSRLTVSHPRLLAALLMD